MERKWLAKWMLRFVKGMFIGSGFILPGVSGGALAAVFGIYERIISFLANVTKNFKENVLFFFPVGLGAVTGLFILSFAVSFLLGNYETPILWFFVGCIVGTIPTLWREAAKYERQPKHIYVLIVAFVGMLLFLMFGQRMIDGQVDQTIWTWTLAGAIIGLGVIVPGLSPSNFLIYLGMYKAMSDGIAAIDLNVILPIGMGALLCVFGLSKIMNYIFTKAYTGLFHFILGVVFASTIMIIPVNYQGFSWLGIAACALLFEGGILLGRWMSRLEEKYK
ncbi:DUF368 domain-containing protein [Amphibacillus sediminis]|uniref:DUF368 domain-containing protein n=1 Tax=Amphibacillus sediminis TaxID=360185 RepID=UPI00082E6D77|nr:DUF368 domain-containing protein [Amphibacillus sediminis]